MYVTAAPYVRIEDFSIFVGGLYAPNSDRIEIKDYAVGYGAFISQGFLYDDVTVVHYDRSLALMSGMSGATPKLIEWNWPR